MIDRILGAMLFVSVAACAMMAAYLVSEQSQAKSSTVEEKAQVNEHCQAQGFARAVLVTQTPSQYYCVR